MRAGRANSGESGFTFTESARRAQIVTAAIETIAELGYPRTSFAQIAKRAGLSSTGLISYHFAGKSELMKQIVIEIYGEITRVVAERTEAQSSASGALQAYIEANVEFSWSHRTEMKALLDIFLSGALDYDAKTERAAVSPLERILMWGQETGEFRDFALPVMATTIQRAVEGPVFLLRGNPELDLKSYTGELVALFALATEKPG